MNKGTVKKYNYVLFHNPCLDGFLSYVVIRQAGLLVDKPFIRGVAPDIKVVPPRIKNMDVLIADLNLDREVIIEILRLAKSVLFIDHHQSSFFVKSLMKTFSNLHVIHDIKSCASKLIYETFLRRDKRKRVPDVIKYINDNDLMLNELENTNFYITAFEVHYNENFGITPSGFNQKADAIVPLLMNNKETKKMIQLGKHYNAYKGIITKRSMNNYEIITIRYKRNPYNGIVSTWKCLVSNIGGFVSKQVANQLQHVSDVDCSIVWYYNVSSKGIRCICRSKNLDVTWLCREYGGSGHRSAGSFYFKSTNIYDWVVFHNSK